MTWLYEAFRNDSLDSMAPDNEDEVYFRQVIARAGRLPDNHGHIEAQITIKDLVALATGTASLPDGLSNQFLDMLYPDVRSQSLTEPYIDWNAHGFGQTDINQLLMKARLLRARAKESSAEYLGLIHVFIALVHDAPYHGEEMSFDDFLTAFDRYATILKQRVTGEGAVSARDLGLMTEWYVDRIVESNKGNSHIEIRIQPKYDFASIKEAMAGAARAARRGEKQNPGLKVNIVVVFRKKENDDVIRDQVNWMIETLKQNPWMQDYIRGWDTASLEVGNPPSRFKIIADVTSVYNHEHRPLHATYHVAEDWEKVKDKGHDIVTAIRYVYEVLTQLHVESLGHIKGVMRPLSGEIITGHNM